jgi:hypothetical protein
MIKILIFINRRESQGKSFIYQVVLLTVYIYDNNHVLFPPFTIFNFSRTKRKGKQEKEQLENLTTIENLFPFIG